MPFVTELDVVVGDTTFQLCEELLYKGSDDLFSVPRGFVTDLASIPGFVTWLIPKLGTYNRPAVVHDYHCESLAGHQPGPVPSSRDVDGLLRRMIREEDQRAGCNRRVRRWLIWTGVRWGALANPARREGWLADFPLVLLISLLALPFVLPASIFVGLALLVDTIVEKVIR